MEDGIEQKYKPLGGRTLMLFIIKRGIFSYIVLLTIIGAFVISRFVPYEYTGILSSIILTGIVIFVISYLVTVFIGWLEYKNYGVYIKGDCFEITKGLFNKEEIGVPYRFVKEVHIERDIADQLFGVSNITINLLGEIDELPQSNEHKIILPSIGKNIAEMIQESILNKSDTHKAKII